MIELRPTVQQAAEQMELVLRANDFKGGWEGTSRTDMQNKLWEELRELVIAYDDYWNQPVEQHNEGFSFTSITQRDRLLKEATDVQNVVMMIADMAGCYPHGLRVNGQEVDDVPVPWKEGDPAPPDAIYLVKEPPFASTRSADGRFPI